MVDDLVQVYGLLSGNNKKESSRKHYESGGMRSGEGTPDQQIVRRKQFEERQKMEDMYSNKERATDQRTSKKQFEYWKEMLNNRRHS